MRPLDYERPGTIDEAVRLMAKYENDLSVLAGGTDLIPQMQEGSVRPRVVMDCKSIPELNQLEYVGNGELHIGSAVNCTDIRALVASDIRYGALFDSCSLVGSIQIQNRSTVGGNLCNGSPSADAVPSLIVLEAQAIIFGEKGRRLVPVEEFVVGPGKTVLESGELLVKFVIPPPKLRSVSHYLRFIPREEMDIAVAGVASCLLIDESEKFCNQAFIALSAVAPTPVRAKEAELVLYGQAITEKEIFLAGNKAVLAASPISDIRGSKEYRMELIKVLTRRSLLKCLESLGV